MMRIIKDKKSKDEFLKKLINRHSEPSKEIVERVTAIIDDVRKNGDKALKRYNEVFDKHKEPLVYEIPDEPVIKDRDIIKMLRFTIKRIKRFHKRQIQPNWQIKEKGIVLGQIIRPLDTVGVYVPGGKASYPSTVLMNIIPAQVAGVKDIVVCMPTPMGEVNPVVISALQELGIKRFYRIGGAQAVAAMAYGTRTIKKVDKIVGPGNIYVATAKRLVFGLVDIDMIAGPSEIVIIADETADARFLAADLLSQAEHDEMASSILITTSEDIAIFVDQQIERLLKTLKKSDIAKKSLKSYGGIIITQDIEEATEIVNTIAPEHLEIMTKDPNEVLKGVRHAGAIFLGAWSPEPIGDYCAGPNHTLPTGGTAKFSSPLGTYDFIKRSSLISVDKQGFSHLAPFVERFATLEGLDAHSMTIRIRKHEHGQ
ncbi:MAG: histidinol dehydrogenase [Thermodesulfovibrionales bacterium]|nr:histidinol dehydrogenase [Thermodesulfovibrionales bacterium]